MTARFLSAVAASSMMLAAPALATPSLWEVFTIDRIATAVTQSFITGLRGFAHVTYVDLDVSPLDGRVVISGLRVSPLEEYSDGECVFTIDRALITTAPLTQIEITALDVDLIGVEASMGCLENRQQRDLAEIGLEELVLDRAELHASYTFSSSALAIDFQAISNDIASLRGNVDFSYVAFDFTGNVGQPVAYLEHAQMELTDLGGSSILEPAMPEFLRDPEVLEAIMLAELLPELTEEAAPVAPVTPVAPPTENKDIALPRQAAGASRAAAQAFVEELAAAVSAFANDPGRIAITVSPPAPVRMHSDNLDAFADFVATYVPSVSTADVMETTRVTAAEAEMLRAWTQGGDQVIPRADQVRFAQAFLSGIGAPRDTALAMEILTPLLEDGDTEALDMALNTLDELDPQFAYEIAHHAAATGNRTAFAHLDRLERLISLEEMRDVQSAGESMPDLTGDETPAELREMGYAHLTGLGSPRHYPMAYYYGLLALAAGDLAAESLIDEVEAMALLGDEDAQSVWRTALAEARETARSHWFADGE